MCLEQSVAPTGARTVFDQFDLTKMLRCSATNEEGFRCLRPPSHEGPHVWARCPALDPDGHQCMLPPRHAGEHYLAWFDRPTAPGETHTAHYGGRRSSAEAQADADGHVFSAHGWRAISREFTPGLPWRWAPLSRWFVSLAAPRGRLLVVYEFQPDEAQGSGAPAQPSNGPSSAPMVPAARSRRGRPSPRIRGGPGEDHSQKR
jgi:hypothetical protein